MFTLKASNEKKAAADEAALNAFLADIGCLDKLAEWTDKFNLFDVLKISRAEIRHSNVLAWLLDPNESHGLGDSVLRGFVQYADPEISLAGCSGFSIYREWHNIDILAVSPGERFLLCIENKIDTGEHDDQLNRYRRLIEEDYPDYTKRYIYLSPEDDESSDPEHWCSMGYRDVLDIVGKARDGADMAPGAALLIDNYIDTVRRDIVGDEELTRVCAEIYAKHQRALDLIFENRPNLSSMVAEMIQRWMEEKTRDGEMEYIPESSTRKNYRFKTKLLSSLLPDVENILSSWKTPNFYFYELRNMDGKELFIQLSIDTKGMPEAQKEISDRICEHFCPSQQQAGRQYRMPFTSRHFRNEDEDLSEERLTGQLNKCFDQMKIFEVELEKVVREI